jgi:hypothetical protein
MALTFAATSLFVRALLISAFISCGLLNFAIFIFGTAIGPTIFSGFGFDARPLSGLSAGGIFGDGAGAVLPLARAMVVDNMVVVTQRARDLFRATFRSITNLLLNLVKVKLWPGAFCLNRPHIT